MWPNPQFPVDLVTFTEETLYGKLHFLCNENYRKIKYWVFTITWKNQYNLISIMCFIISRIIWPIRNNFLLKRNILTARLLLWWKNSLGFLYHKIKFFRCITVKYYLIDMFYGTSYIKERSKLDNAQQKRSWI